MSVCMYVCMYQTGSVLLYLNGAASGNGARTKRAKPRVFCRIQPSKQTDSLMKVEDSHINKCAIIFQRVKNPTQAKSAIFIFPSAFYGRAHTKIKRNFKRCTKPTNEHKETTMCPVQGY